MNPPFLRADPRLPAHRGSRRLVVQGLHDEERRRETLLEKGGVDPEREVGVLGAREDEGKAITDGLAPPYAGGLSRTLDSSGNSSGVLISLCLLGGGVLRLPPGQHAI